MPLRPFRFWPFPAPHWSSAGLASLLAWLFAMAAVILAASWLVRLLSPRPVAALAETQAFAAAPDLSAAYRIFGLDNQPTALAGQYVLTGVFATSDGRGFATFRLPKGPAAVFQGRELAPGVRLAAIEKDHVVLDSGGIRQSLPLKEARAETESAGDDR